MYKEFVLILNGLLIIVRREDTKGEGGLIMMEQEAEMELSLEDLTTVQGVRAFLKSVDMKSLDELEPFFISVGFTEEDARMLRAFEEMFRNPGKIASKVPKEWLDKYREAYYHLRALLSLGDLPRKDDYLGGNALAENIYRRKYFLKDRKNEPLETRPEDVFVRVASFIAAVEEDHLKWAETWYSDMFNGYYLPAGRVLAGAGDLYRVKTLANCFALLIREDSIEGIYETAYKAARTYSYGGGVGIDVTPLRPAGTPVHNAAETTTGPTSFMQLYSLTTGIIGQAGRRGALMITIDVKHPDVVEFINVKRKPDWVAKKILEQLRLSGKFSEEELKEIEKAVVDNAQIRFANISVKVSDEFMNAVREQNEYGADKILVYKKKYKGIHWSFYQDKDGHYSYGIPSRDLRYYEFVGAFDSVDELNHFLNAYGARVSEEELKDVNLRDIYGDFVIELGDRDYDLAIHYSGDFLLYYANEQIGEVKRLVKARDIWNEFVESNYKTAEPGIMFWTRMVYYSPSNYVGAPIIGTNPCSEVPLEDGGACNLGSISLPRMVDNPYTEDAKINWDRFRVAIHHLVRLLDNVVDWNSYMNALPEQREAAKRTRRIGAGYMGLADMLNMLGYAYDSEEGIRIIEEVTRFYANEAYSYSSDLAVEKGPFPLWDYEKYSRGLFFQEALSDEVKEKIRRQGLRNVALLSMAPTGSLSNIALGVQVKGKNYVGVSSGIEPVFALYYTRRSESLSKDGDMYFKVFHPPVQAYLDMMGLAEEAQRWDLHEILPPHFFRTAHEIDPMMRVRIQGVIQKYVDHSISSTVNLPEDVHPEVISDIYLAAWEQGLKGITIYRDGSRFPVLSVDGKKTEFQEFKDRIFVLVRDGEEIKLRGDDVLVLPDGRLTTVYHAIKEGILNVAR
ncbi:MAG: ribonucleoside-diphosphate reductase alpha chain [Candidatus Diapherotrites archaeon]|nr:ribonucleoside-diphosphate reductase alpha chain [Candidatus Diapherotrites archaeon]